MVKIPSNNRSTSHSCFQRPTRLKFDAKFGHGTYVSTKDNLCIGMMQYILRIQLGVGYKLTNFYGA